MENKKEGENYLIFFCLIERPLNCDLVFAVSKKQ